MATNNAAEKLQLNIKTVIAILGAAILMTTAGNQLIYRVSFKNPICETLTREQVLAWDKNVRDAPIWKNKMMDLWHIQDMKNLAVENDCNNLREDMTRVEVALTDLVTELRRLDLVEIKYGGHTTDEKNKAKGVRLSYTN